MKTGDTEERRSRTMPIPIAKVHFTEQEKVNILKPLETGWVVQGPFVKEFEQKWSDFAGVKHSIAVTSCTTALHLALSALGVGAGDEVIVPSFTWVATANIVESLGAKPVFCDISLDTFNINGDLIEHLITGRTKAVIPVHLFGLAADMDKITAIAGKHHLDIVEDAACGFAAKYKGIHVGNIGRAGCFSFHPRKAITTGEGGMITTNDDAFAEKLRAMRDHGATVSDLQRHSGAKPYLLPEFPYLGYNYRMTDIQAAIGSSQMDRAGEISRLRSSWAARYGTALEGVSWLKKPFSHPNYQHGYQAYVCLFEPQSVHLWNVEAVNARRNAFMEYLQQRGISTRPGTHAVHMLKYYREKYRLKNEDFPNSCIADRCSIAFPFFPSMTDLEFDFILDAVRDYDSRRRP